MMKLGITITELVEDGQPPFVGCEFLDASGARHELLEKLPIVSAADSLPTLPAPGVVACALLDVRAGGGGRQVVRVDIGRPWGCETVAGVTVVEVFEDQLSFPDEVEISVDGALVPASVVGTNEGMNYGRLAGLVTVPYQAVLPLARLDWYAAAFAELVEDLREDERKHPDADGPSALARMGYPQTLAAASREPALFAEVLETFAERTLLGHHFPFDPTAKFVINSTGAIWVVADRVVITGRCWVRGA